SGLQVGFTNYLGSGSGVVLGFLNLGIGDLVGLQIGLLNLAHWETFRVGQEGIYEVWQVNRYASTFRGLQASAWNRGHAVHGLQLTGLVNEVWGELRGAQVGPVNVAGQVRGLQIGLVNVARDLRGVQIGAINVAVRGGALPVLPVLNVGL
ncbi:MAG: hypothetical protein AAF602_21215, partial [Myxococcota bacterium]